MNNKEWFSWFWLIFWAIVCFPIAILYLLVKLGDMKGSSLQGSSGPKGLSGPHGPSGAKGLD